MEFLLLIIIGLLIYIAFYTPEKRAFREKKERQERRRGALDAVMTAVWKKWEDSGKSYDIDIEIKYQEDLFEAFWPEEKD